jgi:3'(2'), 5'-bisphosphate nucleotidase
MIDIRQIVDIAKDAGKAVLDVYHGSSGVTYETKSDGSPLTKADLASNKIIVSALKKINKVIPIVSEEQQLETECLKAKEAERYWLVDPLDGTKEFIKRNGQFTVNIALIENNRPLMGVVYAPALDLMYYGAVGSGAQKVDRLGRVLNLPIQAEDSESTFKVVVSNSHMNDATSDYISDLPEQKDRKVELVPMGSSLKLCLVAEGAADLYPRLGPTMYWDIAAGHAILLSVSKDVVSVKNNETLCYSLENEMKFESFICQ